MSDYKAVSDDQWFVVQAISVDGECPAGQKFWGCRLWTDQRFSTDAASRVVVNPNGSCDRGDGTQYCFMDVVPCELYLAPSAGFHVDAHRNGSTGTAQLNVYLSGYLTNQAQITN